uniref:MULE transposase domain-containing protein n=1 Tax=Lactuca sativa TaxID=4236 RepID=A0A9R1UKP7_LACSA|nr:hypothetical protein LSAT_V11C900486020 [Lactuca sativa]
MLSRWKNLRWRIRFKMEYDSMTLSTKFIFQHRLIRHNILLKYPSVVGKVMNYIPLQIMEENDVEIMFDVLSLHQELSNIDIYLEVEVNGNKNHTEITPSGFDMNNEEDENAIMDGDDIKLPSNFTTSEGIGEDNIDTWMVSQSERELIRAINLYTIRKHLQYEVVKRCSTIWKNRIIQDHPHLDASLIAQETKHLIKEQPSISVPTLRVGIIDQLRRFGWESRRLLKMIIVEWCTTILSNMDQVELRCAFWSFSPSMDLSIVESVISIDAHIYMGKMMIVMGVDGNTQFFPLAFAIVENESYSSWFWFLNHVKKHVVKERYIICLIFDRHSGNLKVVLFMTFVNNFHDKFRNSNLKSLAYRARIQNQICKFNSIMEEIGKLIAQPHQ